MTLAPVVAVKNIKTVTDKANRLHSAKNTTLEIYEVQQNFT